MRSEVRSFCWKDFPSSPAVGGWTFLFFRWQKYLWSRRELSRLLEPETKRLKSQTLVEREEEEGNHGVGDHLGPEIDQLLLMSRGHFELIASAHNCSPVPQAISFCCLIMVQDKLRGHKRNNRDDKKHWLARRDLCPCILQTISAVGRKTHSLPEKLHSHLVRSM